MRITKDHGEWKKGEVVLMNWVQALRAGLANWAEPATKEPRVETAVRDTREVR